MGADPLLPSSFYLEGEPHVAPATAVAHYCQQLGVGVEQLGVRPVVVGTFSPLLSTFLAGRAKAVANEHWIRTDVPAFIGDEYSIVTLPIGAPAAAILVEELIYCGMRTLILPVASGGLQPHLPIGSLVVPTTAIREEGTSHHYAPHDVPAAPSARIVSAIEAALRKGGVEYTSGLHWTTDAVYREHRAKVDHYRNLGVLSVDMELSALFTIAACRDIECAALVVISDELHGDTWEIGFGSDARRRSMMRAGDIVLGVARRLASG